MSAVLHHDYIESDFTSEMSKDEYDVAGYINENEKNDYSDVLKSDERWLVFYHLSSMRLSVLNWYEFKQDGALLEIGAEFGAITGMLCERCASVTAVVDSVFQGEAIAKRHYDRHNLDIFIRDFKNLQLTKKYDYIIMVGAFEKLFDGSANRQKYADYLLYLKQFLNDDGKILVAMSNRYGIKYFCGAKDEFENKAFAGINGYPDGSIGYAFSKNEIEDIIRRAKFHEHKLYYPMPDYILPQVIYSEEYLPTGEILDRVLPYYPHKESLVAVETDLYHNIIENRVFDFFTNSFLIECSEKENICDIVYATVSTDRGEEHAFATSIHANGMVSKRALYKEGEENLSSAYGNILELKKRKVDVIEHCWKNGEIWMPLIKNDSFMDYLYKTITKDKKEFLSLMDNIYQTILKSAEHVEPSDGAYGVILEKAYIDMVPMNCFWIDGKFCFFDQEFVKEKCPAKYVMFRNILYFYNFNPKAENFIPQEVLKKRYDMACVWDDFMEEERKFVADNRNWDLYGNFYGWTMIDRNQIYHREVFDKAQKSESSQEGGIRESAKIEDTVYEKSDTLAKIQQTEKGILAKFHKVCQENELTYFAVYGSLLGAVRHHDMIPWDDDIDVAMPREDYDKLIQIAEKVFESPFFLQLPENDAKCFYGGYAKLRYNLSTGIELRNWNRDCNHGIWIDIFPLDNFICDNQYRTDTLNKIRRYQELLFAKSYGKECPPHFNNISLKAWKKNYQVARYISRDRLCKCLNKYIKKGNEKSSPYFCIAARYLSMNDYCFISKEAFARSMEVPFGEGSIMIPQGYQECLNIMAGFDYMKLPPLDIRRPHHAAFYAYNIPYKTYLKRFRGVFCDIDAKKIVVWGAGSMAERYLKRYHRKFNPEFLVDDDMGKWGLVRYGHMIKAPEALFDIPRDKLHLIICSKYYRIIEEELAQLGIDEYYIYVEKEEDMVENA